MRQAWQTRQSGGRAQDRCSGRQRGILRPGAGGCRRHCPLVVDRLADAGGAPLLGSATRGRRDAACGRNPGSDLRLRAVRRGGRRHPGAHRPDRAAGDGRTLPLRPQSHVLGRDRDHRRPGSAPGPDSPVPLRPRSWSCLQRVCTRNPPSTAATAPSTRPTVVRYPAGGHACSASRPWRRQGPLGSVRTGWTRPGPHPCPAPASRPDERTCDTSPVRFADGLRTGPTRPGSGRRG